MRSHVKSQTLLVGRRELCAAGFAAVCALACGATRAFGAVSAAPAGTDQPAEPVGPAGPAADPVEVAFPVTLVDDAGREVVVESLDAVVACMGSFAKAWELAGGTLAGVTSDVFEFSGYDLACADAVTVVGDFTEPNLEQILALSPTLVIMSGSTAGKGGQASQVDLVAPLESAGIPVLTLNVTVFADYLRMMRTFCDLTGREDLYQANALDVQARVDAVVEASARAVEERAEAGEPASTCLIMTTYSGGTRVSTGSSQAGAILVDLGGVNLADENPSLLRDFSMESVIAMDPDFIFALPMGNDPEAAEKALRDQTEANPAWAGLTAVAEGRYVVLDPALFLYKPLNRWDEAYRCVAAALYGEAVLEDALLSEPTVQVVEEVGSDNTQKAAEAK